MHLDGFDLLGVLRVIRRHLHEATVWSHNEVMRGCGLTESHSIVRFAAVHDASMMIGFGRSLCQQSNGNAQHENRMGDPHGEKLYLISAHIGAAAAPSPEKAQRHWLSGTDWTRRTLNRCCDEGRSTSRHRS